LAGDEHTQITVTELHDTVQVIKELYATVLERNTANAPTTSGRPSRPLELDLGTPLAAAAAYVPPPNGRVREAPKSRELEERFTELPTEVGLDLDLSTVAMASAPSPLVEFHLPAEASRGAAEAWQLAAAAPPDGAGPAPATPRASIGEGGTRPVVDLAPAKAAAGGFPDEHLTQTPTEVQIDIDVGPTTGFSDTVGRSGGRLGLTRRPEAEAPRKPSLEPIDLQLDLSKPEARIRRRSA
jgi:hypothetical protein